MVLSQIEGFAHPPQPEAEDATAAMTPALERRKLRAQTEFWRRKYLLNAEAVANISLLLMDVPGLDAAAKWEDRFYLTMCPELMGKRWPDLLLAWLKAKADVTPEQ